MKNLFLTTTNTVALCAKTNCNQAITSKKVMFTYPHLLLNLQINKGLLTMLVVLSLFTSKSIAQTWNQGGNSTSNYDNILGNITDGTLQLITHDTTRLIIKSNGNVGIGTDKTTGYRLSVDGRIRTRGIRVYPGTWSDFVFSPSYKYPALEELETYIQKNKHLPNVPSEATVKEKGIDVGEMNAILLEQIEVLNLRLIELSKKVKELEKEKK